MEKITSGEVIYEGQDVTKRSVRKKMNYNKDVQMIFQDSMSSLNPKKRVVDIIAEPLRNFERLSDQEDKIRRKTTGETASGYRWDARRCFIQIPS